MALTMAGYEQCRTTGKHDPHTWYIPTTNALADNTRYCIGVTSRQAALVQTHEGAPRQAGTATRADGLEDALRSLAARYDDHADDVDLGPAGDPARRAAAQLRLVAVLHREGIYDRTTAYVWLQSGRRLLVELLELHEIEHRG